MNLELHRFLNDSRSTFAESEPRPPVPGEENESESNGKVSSRSSESRKSHSSSRKSFSPGHGSSASPKVDKSNPLPRKSSNETIYCNKDSEESAAPLGFEPEGEVSNSGPFTEVSVPSCLRWASNVECLLEDGEGVKLFKQFLDQEQNSNCLEFYFACQGLKLIPASDEVRIQSLVKLIYKKYIKGNQLALKSEIKKIIAEKLKNGGEAIEQHIFNDAQREIEQIIKTDAYPQFLKSDTYLQYLQSADSESPRVSDGSSGCPSARPLSAGLLPTVHEDEELQHEDLRRDSPSSPLSHTPVNLAVIMQQGVLRSVASDGCFLRPRSNKPYHAYHTSYAPTSAQDSASELQSLSSDAQTDETLSQTDGSIDGRDSKKWKKRAMKKNAHVNRQTGPHHQLLIPRQDRVSRDGNIAETNPDKFSSILIEKLLRVKEEHEKLERVRDTMKAMEAAEEHPGNMAVRVGDVPSASANLPLQALLSFTERERGDENPQSILDDHLSRVWDSSDHHTPLRSPGGQQSPQPWTGGGRKPQPNLPVMAAGQQGLGVTAKRREVSSSLPVNLASKMAAAGSSYPGVKDMRQRRPLDCEPVHAIHVPPAVGGYVTLWNDTPQVAPHRRSHGDSGVDTTPASSGTGQEPLVDKVLQWMMRSDISPAAGDASFAQKRPQHKPSISPQQHRSHRKSQPVRPNGPSAELGERQATIDGQSAFSVPWQHADISSVVKSRSVNTGLSGIDARQSVSQAKAGDDSMMVPVRSHNVSSVTSPGSDVTVVGYYFCGEPIPYRTTVSGHQPMTLAQFKALIMKKGNYRYFFKTVSDEFDSGIVHEEVKDDDAVLPFFDGKIICRVEKADQS